MVVQHGTHSFHFWDMDENCWAILSNPKGGCSSTATWRARATGPATSTGPDPRLNIDLSQRER